MSRLPHPDEGPDLTFIVGGIFVMLVASFTFVLMPAVGAREVLGLGVIFFIGLGLVVAGSPDPRKE